MKIGKVSQTVLKRSMLKTLTFHRNEALFTPTAEEMCYGVMGIEGEDVLCASCVLYGNEKDLGVFALAHVLNDLATRGAKMVGAEVHIMLPPYAYESRLKSMMEHMEEVAENHQIQILGAKAEVSPVVSQAVVYVNGIGLLKKGMLLQSSMGKAGQDIVLLKWIGLEGTFRAMRAKETELRERFVPTFFSQIQQMEHLIFSEQEIEIARETGVSAMHQITEGGILAALWEMAESSGVGLQVDLKKMSIRQETVEICEFCHLNPYQMTSAGSILIFTENGEELIQRYGEAGIKATLLGRTTANAERVITGGEEKRFLDRPATDELLKLYEQEGSL